MTAQELAYQLSGTEGESAISTLNEIAEIIGYQAHGFRYGSAFEQFLADNSDCVEVILEWIDNQNNPEWNEDLSMDEEDEEDEE